MNGAAPGRYPFCNNFGNFYRPHCEVSRKGLTPHSTMKLRCQAIGRVRAGATGDFSGIGLDRRREALLSIVLFSGKFITCLPRLKSKFGLKSRMSFSSTLLVTRSFRLTSSGQ